MKGRHMHGPQTAGGREDTGHVEEFIDPEAQEEAARLAALRVLHTWQLVREGRAPRTALLRVLQPQVIDALGDAAQPAPPGQTSRLTGLRLQVVTRRLAHGAAVIRHPDNTAEAIVFELRRDGQALPWQVTQLTSAADRGLVAYTDEDISDRRTTRLPDDLTEPLHAARRAREDAAAHVEHYRAARQPAERQQLYRWRQRLADLDTEIRDLEETQRAREVRQAVLDGDPTVAARLHQLEDLLGDVPDDTDRRAQWRAAASLVVGYRQRWNVADVRRDLTRDHHDDPHRASERDVAIEAVEAYTGRPLTQDGMASEQQSSPARENERDADFALER